MALSTYSKFYYGFEVKEGKQAIEFVEGGITRFTTLTVGTYTLAGLVAELERAFLVAGMQSYEVTADRADRTITITSSADFDLPIASGTYATQSVFSVLGFDPTIDLSGESSYTTQSGAGAEYVVQFPLQSYVPADMQQRAVDPKINKSTAGVFEVVQFGTEKVMQCEILFANDFEQMPGGLVRTNPSGVQDLKNFLIYACKKAEVEFIVDENFPAFYEVHVLEKTEEDSNGLGFKLKEDYDKDLPGYWRSGKLTWLLRDQE